MQEMLVHGIAAMSRGEDAQFPWRVIGRCQSRKARVSPSGV